MAAHRLPRWTTQEDALLRDTYPGGGAEAARARLPHRSWLAIYNRAYRLGLRRPAATNNATAPRPKLCGPDLEEAIRLREREGWTYARIAMRFGICETAATNAILIALCTRSGFTPAQRDDKGRMTEEGKARLRLALRKGMKPVDIQLRLGISSARISEERRRYSAELKAQRKVPLPPPGGGEAYPGAKIPRESRREVESLLLQGFGSLKISQRTGVSSTTIGRIRARLVRRLRRKGECLPGCDLQGRRHVQAESARFITEGQKQALRQLLLDRVPVNRAAGMVVIGSCAAYRLRDELAQELAARGEELPAPRFPGRIAGGGYPVDPHWPPRGPKQIYAFRALLRDMEFDDARTHWLRTRRAEQQSEARRPRSFEEQLARVERGEIRIVAALPRTHLEPLAIPERI